VQEAEWRVALAQVHAGVPQHAAAWFNRACATDGPYRERSCEAARVLAK
jgi:hypothetical protein